MVALCAILLNALGHQLYLFFKPLTTILILLFAIVFGQRGYRYCRLVCLALGFCLVGDLFLLNGSYFIWGLLAFLIAHLLFTLGFVSLGGFTFSWRPLAALLVFGVTYYANLYGSLKGLAYPVLVYLAVILLMSWQGINLRLRTGGISYTLIAIAVILFLFSDAVLAWARFKSPFWGDGVVVLTTYWGSIFLIALSTSSLKARG